jgi:hypothetical protein
MNFNALVKDNPIPTFQKYGFEILEEAKNILRVQSSVIEMHILFNNYEKSCSVFLGKKGGPLCELRDNAIRDVFKSSLQIEHLSPEDFAKNLYTLFETEKGIEILNGNIGEFLNFKILEDEAYTLKLIQGQALELVSKAWHLKDYSNFIENIEKIGLTNVSGSYL